MATLEEIRARVSRDKAEIEQTENAMPTLEELRDMAAGGSRDKAIDEFNSSVRRAHAKIQDDCMMEAYESGDLARFDLEGCIREATNSSDSIFDITILDFILNIKDAPALMLLVPVAMFVLFLYMRRK